MESVGLLVWLSGSAILERVLRDLLLGQLGEGLSEEGDVKGCVAGEDYIGVVDVGFYRFVDGG